ncbi:MAG: beta-ketoacyl-ACP synthase II [Gammaproteobacteria bacterium]|nr:beta-ketoacyl-ACP synthase II [Gammaproteobacteria bacterium]
MSKRRVVVTGLGIVSPVGNSVDAAWENIKAGNSGIGPITLFDPSNYPTRIAGEVRDFDIGEYLSPKEARRMDAFIHYGMAASIQAVRDSGFEVTEDNAHRIGAIVGAGIGGLESIEQNSLLIEKHDGPKKVSPFFVPGSIINMISGNLSIMYGLRGPNLSVVTACTTATHSIGLAARTIAYGDADIMVAGGAEHATTTLGIGGFCAARALSTRNDEPEKASRPWDKDRDGFVLSDGAGVLIMEEYEHAKARGAKIYCELVGFGMSGDAHHITSPPDDGEGARQCMSNAMADAGIKPEDVDYINAHGTSTQVGDKGETIAIRRAFGSHADKLAVSSTKSMTGHLLGAAGGVEAVFSALAVRDNIAPPTINLDNPDEGCDLDYVPGSAREMNIDIAMSNSFGFGGTNGTLIFRKV